MPTRSTVSLPCQMATDLSAVMDREGRTEKRRQKYHRCCLKFGCERSVVSFVFIVAKLGTQKHQNIGLIAKQKKEVMYLKFRLTSKLQKLNIIQRANFNS
jgi:hypothetical protein